MPWRKYYNYSIWGGAGATYQFYIGGALQTNTTPNTLTFTAPGDGVIIEIVGTNTDGCSSSVYAITFLNDITDPGTIGSDETVCYNVTPPTISSTTGATFPTGASYLISGSILTMVQHLQIFHH